MSELFGIDISGIIADNMDGNLYDGTITRAVKGARDPANLMAGRASAPATFATQGIWQNFHGTPPAGVEVLLTDRVAMLIGDLTDAGGLPLQQDDAVTINGITQYMVAPIATDPAGATYTYLCRDRKGPDGA